MQSISVLRDGGRRPPMHLLPQGERGRSRAARQPNSISPAISCVRLTPPMVSTIFAGSFSLPLSLPLATASRTAFSISRCEVMPTFLRKPRRLLLKLSSFIVASPELRPHRIIQHLLRHVPLGAIGAGVGIAALDVAVLAAIDVFVRARRNVVGAAVGIVIGRGVDHDRLAALEAAGEKRGDEQECEGKA